LSVVDVLEYMLLQKSCFQLPLSRH